ncbi:MAG: hypothetical protein BGP01_03590 [Paludibacter sp. 47-17]|nr:MAG: hypothetical protein BGP01_03590 [Paludibacter sp. 47-17]
MEDFGDYIYLIAIVIAGLSSLLKKKKPAANRQEPAMPDLDDVLPELEEEYIPRRDATTRPEPVYEEASDYWYPAQTVVPAPAVQQVERVPVSYETVADFMKLRAKKTVQKKNQVSEEMKPVEVADSPEMQIELDSAEDVKRAFVYSEIFNRKY